MSRTITAQIGTTGIVRTRKLTSVLRDLRWAIYEEHGAGCDNNTCDIDAATNAGFVYVAAWLLTGATETPLLSAVLEAWRVELYPFPKGLDRWRRRTARHSRACPDCEATVYDAEAVSCGNCAAELPTSSRPVE